MGELWGLKTILTVFCTFYSRAVLVAELSWGFAPGLPSVIGSVCHRMLALGNFLGSASHSSIVENFIIAVFVSGAFSFLFKVGSGDGFSPLPSTSVQCGRLCLPCPLQSHV